MKRAFFHINKNQHEFHIMRASSNQLYSNYFQMKKYLKNSVYFLPLFIMAVVTIFVTGCEMDEDNSVPVITRVLNYAPSPNDTVVTNIQAGQWVVLEGRNLGNVNQVNFGSIPAIINPAFFTDKSIVVQLPPIPFESVPADELNVITAFSKNGDATFNINIVGAPLIQYVRNFADSPNDTIINTIFPNQLINIIGYNLENATNIAFQGIAADLSTIAYTDTSAIVMVPGDLSGSDVILVNTITYSTNFGTGSAEIKIVGPPTITGVSYEIPNPGDLVYIYGYNFVSVQSLTFAGAEITSYEILPDESTISFLAPELTQSGPVVITTLGGTFTTNYNVNDTSTGIISDFEWGDTFHWEWWGGAELYSPDPASEWPPYSPDFPGSSGMYLILKTNVLAAGEGNNWSTAVRMGEVQWLPVENLSDPVNNWVLKFEISIPEPWNGGTLCIVSSLEDYMFRYEPWQVSSSSTNTYTTNGWQTVSIPLSSFRRNDAVLGQGKGEPITNLIELIGHTGLSNMILYMHNFGTSPTSTGFYAGFDNFRVVKR